MNQFLYRMFEIFVSMAAGNFTSAANKNPIKGITKEAFNDAETLKDDLFAWADFPWHKPELVDAVLKSEGCISQLPELLNLGKRVLYSNTALATPGAIYSESQNNTGNKYMGFSKKIIPFSKYPVRGNAFDMGKITFRLNIIDSPITAVEVSPYKSRRTFYIGTRATAHLGGFHSETFHALYHSSREEEIINVMSSSSHLYRCLPARIDDSVTDINSLFSAGNNFTEETKKKFRIKISDLNTVDKPKIGAINTDLCDYERTTKGFAPQVFRRSCGVFRLEGVGLEEEKFYDKETKTLVKQRDDTRFTPKAFTPDSPSVLFEMRPKRQNDLASIVMAGPQLCVIGIENKCSTDTPEPASILDESMYKFGGGENFEKTNNVFAVLDNKNLNNCWIESLPKGKQSSVYNNEQGVFGIFGGKNCINALSSKTANNKFGKNGMEIFGQDVVSIGAGTKLDGRNWSSSITTGKDIIEILKLNENERDRNSGRHVLLSLENDLLKLECNLKKLRSKITMCDTFGIHLGVSERGDIQDTLKSVININQNSISLMVNKSGIRITSAGVEIIAADEKGIGTAHRFNQKGVNFIAKL